MDLAPGTRVLVTGATRGIGAAIADAFAARGCEVGRVARSGELPADVADADSIASAIERFGAVDVLVANAGIAHYLPFREMSLETVEELTRVNWLGTVNTVRAALPGMLERGRGQIAIVSSGAGIRSFPGAAVYGATKAAQRGFGEALRHELAGSGVGLTMVYPGQIKTALHDHERERMPRWYRPDRTTDAGPLAAAVLKAVESDAREVFYPRNVRLLRILHGLWPRLADAMLRRIMHPSAAPRR
jgi:short-subunit dehydrogenase